jgi:glycogen phosphorylase
VLDPIVETLLASGDFYLHLADLRSYSEAHARLGQFYRNPEAWARAGIANISSSGRFSSDRTIA